MAVLDLFSNRMKRQRGEVPDVYKYDDLPDKLRVQIIHIWRATLGHRVEIDIYPLPFSSTESWHFVLEGLRRERGTFQLIKARANNRHDENEVAQYFLDEGDVERALDVVQLVFQVILFHREVLEQHRQNDHLGELKQTPEEAIDELNARFKEHGVGYQFENGQIVRVDSQLLHAEIVKPALALLHDKAFAGPNDEFLKAHEHHRHGRQEECLVDCLKAFESTMKVICDKRGWPYDKNKDTVSKLIDVVFTRGLIAPHVQGEFTALRGILESGLPPTRNRNAGHGQGARVRTVPPYLAAYALHTTAANIVFLVEAHKALP